MTSRLPTYYVAHGGGPWPWLLDELPFDLEPLADSLRTVGAEVGDAPAAILMISPHWETAEPTVQTNPNPPMLYDYWGFPAFTFDVQYPAPGSPAVATRVTQLLSDAGFAVREDAERGFDHGSFVPLAVAFPDASIPVVQLSILMGYDPTAHLAMGRALAPLRDEGVLIVGSGMSYHNMHLMGPAAAAPSAAFDRWLTDTSVGLRGVERAEALLHWDQAPSARVAHPAEDHLIPLLVVAAAAGDEEGQVIYHQDDLYGSVHATAYRFGRPVPAV
jgi:aromatic ring-opening dioxygenase catalytic subunit (LigB family)